MVGTPISSNADIANHAGPIARPAEPDNLPGRPGERSQAEMVSVPSMSARHMVV